MNQDLTDTVKQAAGKEHIPDINHANPPRVIGDWNEAEVFYRYGHAARAQYGKDHPAWNDALNQKLKSEWMTAQSKNESDWEARKDFVRKGYEFEDTSPGMPLPVPTRAAATTKPSQR